MASDGTLVSSSISWFPGALKTGTPAVAAILRNSSYCSCMRLGWLGCLPEMVSPVQSTKAAGGFRAFTAAKISPGVGGCLHVLCAGRLSPASTKTNFVGSEGSESLPVFLSGERAGICPEAAGENWRMKKRNRLEHSEASFFTCIPFVRTWPSDRKDFRRESAGIKTNQRTPPARADDQNRPAGPSRQ